MARWTVYETYLVSGGAPTGEGNGNWRGGGGSRETVAFRRLATDSVASARVILGPLG